MKLNLENILGAILVIIIVIVVITALKKNGENFSAIINSFDDSADRPVETSEKFDKETPSEPLLDSFEYQENDTNYEAKAFDPQPNELWSF